MNLRTRLASMTAALVGGTSPTVSAPGCWAVRGRLGRSIVGAVTAPTGYGCDIIAAAQGEEAIQRLDDVPAGRRAES